MILEVKGFLLKDEADQEFLLAIQLASHGMFERLVFREHVGGSWIDVNANSQEAWVSRAEAVSAVLGYLQQLRSESDPASGQDR
ncbi:MAG: hypothetical protein KF814_16640 [Nitrospiraceae bacterium]|nr:hypothetical protein [Nitrospiraceae bacterium]